MKIHNPTQNHGFGIFAVTILIFCSHARAADALVGLLD